MYCLLACELNSMSIFAFMRFLITLSIAFIFFGCNESTSDRLIPDHDANPNPELTGTLSVEYAENFQLKRTESGYIVDIIDPDTGDIEKSYTVEKAISKRIIGLTSTLNGMLSILNATDLLVGVSAINYVHSPEIKSRFEQGEIAEFGDETTYSIEKIIASKANTILYSGFGDEFPNHEKLEKLGFSIIPIYDWREIDPLGKAEWIKLVGILSGKEQEAIAFFEDVKKKYFETLELAKSVKSKPTVISGNLIGDIWYAPAGNSYMAKMITDAGGDYVYKNTEGTGSTERSIEQILKDNHTTEIWMNPGMSNKTQISKINPHAQHLKAYDNLYCYSKNTNLFWERSAAEPHLMLSDLIHIFHPEIEEINTLFFYQKITE